MTNNQPRVERGITKLITPHEKGELISIHPAKGPDTYGNVGQAILNDTQIKQRLQTGYETTLMLNPAYARNEQEFKDIKGIMKNNYLHIFQVAHWLPEQDKNSGVYSVHDSKALGRNIEFNQEELEEMLRGAGVYQGVRFNPDTGVAFAPRNTIHLGKQKDWNSFSRDGLVIATYFPEGAENLFKLGKENFKYGYIWGVSGNNQVETRLSALYGNWDDDRLYIDGYVLDDYVNGLAFGEASQTRA
ncbi:hypothetical protein HOD29_02240 [archaeon]|jgi:hypothetical protein|nr:hypothetical protein [archaeon]